MNATVKKLRYAAQDTVLVLNAPQELAWLVSAFTEQSARVDQTPQTQYGFVVAFAPDMASAERLGESAAPRLEGDGIFWLCYPKGTSKRYPKPDLNRDSLWSVLEPHNMRPVAQVSIDNDWSAIRFRRSEYVKA